MLSMPIQKLSRRRRRNGSDRRNARKSPACAGKQRKKNKKKMILPQSCKGKTAVQAQGKALRLNCRFSLTTLGKYHLFPRPSLKFRSVNLEKQWYSGNIPEIGHDAPHARDQRAGAP